MSSGPIPERLQELGKLDHHGQEPWKLPLSAFIERLYFKRFDNRRPDGVVSIEEGTRREEDRKTVKRGLRRQTRRGDDAQG